MIKLDCVSKRFLLRYNRAETLKSKLIGVLHKRYREVREQFWALRDVSLTISAGESVGLIGRNGSGKSTLLKILAGIVAPTTGTIEIQRGARIGALIELGVGFDPELTGRENVYLGASIHGLSRREIDDIYPRIVDFSEVGHFIDVPLKNYSSGMQMRLAFAIAAQLDPDILLLDEELAVGDGSFQEKCLETIEAFKRRGTAIVMVSHSMGNIEKFTERVFVFEKGSVAFAGRPREAIAAYDEILATSFASAEAA